jgi:MFS family permease
MILIGLAFGSGFALGPALGATVAHLWPGDTLVAVSLVAAVLNLINLAAVVWRLPETKGTRLPGHAAGAQTESPLSWRAELARLWGTPGFLAVLAVQFLQVFSFVGVETILPMALRDAYALDDRAIYGAFVVIGVASLVANGGLARPVLARLGEVRTLLAGQALLALGVLAIPVFAPDARLLNLGLVLLAVGTGLSNPALSSIVSRLAPRASQGFALGTAQTLSAGARIAGPLALGVLYEVMHGARSLAASFLLLVVGGLVAGLGLARARRRFQADDAADDAIDNPTGIPAENAPASCAPSLPPSSSP